MNNFLIYKSSAGSGKTSALVQQYLTLIFREIHNPARYQQILAITFTNKAAAEMRERILRELKKFASADIEHLKKTDYLLKAVVENTGHTAEDIQKSSRAILRHILHQYSNLHVRTIDSFNLQVVRSFSRDLKLTHNFEIVLDTMDILNKAVERVLQNVSRNEEIADSVLKLVAFGFETEKNLQVKKELTKVGRLILSDAFSEEMEAELASFTHEDLKKSVNLLNLYCTDFEGKLKDCAASARQKVFAAGLEATDFKGGYLLNFLKSWEAGDLRKPKIISTTTEKALKDGDPQSFFSKTTYKGLSPQTISMVVDLIEILQKGYALFNKHLQEYCLVFAIRNNLYQVSLIKHISAEFKKILEDENLLPLSDFNKLIAGAIKGEPVPFIYERIGDKFRNIMMDEFQDTSVYQWQNFLPLIAESLGHGRENLIVGDAKQSIYRWRGGEPQQFIRLPEIKTNPSDIAFIDIARIFRSAANVQKLDFNYRSLPSIVKFNNQLFSAIANNLKDFPDHLKEQYLPENLHQKTGRAETGGYIKMDCLKQSTDTQLMVMQLLREQIEEALADGFTYADMAILVRTNEMAKELGIFLQQHEIPIVTPESYNIDQSPEVNFVVNVMTQMAEPGEMSSTFEIMQYLLASQNRSADLPVLWEKYKHRKVKLEEFLKAEALPSIADLSATGPLILVAETIIKKFLPSATYQPFLSAFIEFLFSIAKRQGNNLLDFLQLWKDADNRPALKLPPSPSAIQIITIHSAKGLQYKVCFLPQLNWDYQSKGNCWIKIPEQLNLPLKHAIIPLPEACKLLPEQYPEEEQLAVFDSLNLIYVATTRAEERLYGIVTESKSNFTGKLIAPAIEAIFDGWDLPKNRIHHSDSTSHASYIFGDRMPPVKPSEADKAEEFLPYTVMDAGNWKEKVQIAVSYLDEKKGVAAKNTGMVLHRILSESASEAEALEQLIRSARNGLVSPEEKEQIRAAIVAIYNYKPYSTLLEAGYNALKERELFDGQNILRPDLVLESSGHAIVVDYKSGAPQEKYHSQVRSYIRALETIGYKNVEGYLMYTQNLQLEKVKPDHQPTLF